jgi:hypothetical protein
VSGNLVGSVSIPLGRDLRLITELSPYFTTRYNINQDDPIHEIHGYARLDGKISLEGPQNRWAVDLIGKNITDRVIPITTITSAQDGKERPGSVALQARFQW